MCYYSTTMHGTRAAKKQEDLVVSTHLNHGVIKGESDGKVVCVMDNTTIHLEKLKLSHAGNSATTPSGRHISDVLRDVILAGKPVSGIFTEYHAAALYPRRRGYSADAIIIDGVPVHLLWLKEGSKCYVGDKKVPMENRMGLGHPPVIHDPLPSDEAPTLGRMLARVAGLCSINR